MKILRIVALIWIVNQCLTPLVFGSADSIGPNGINSAGLGLTGSGVSIGQVEPERPGLPAFDGSDSHSSVVPAAIFEVTTGQGGLTAGANTADHAEQVAGVLISNDTTARGVAPGASLYASAHLTGPSSGSADFDQTLLTIQHIATQSNMRAVNHSWGKVLPLGQQLNGNSKLTMGLDWSATTHDVLHVVAAVNAGPQGLVLPKDNYNGITVGISSKLSGVYRIADVLNGSPASIPSGRTMIDLIAPGVDVRSTKLNNMLTPAVPNADIIDDGTSFAAPHVTGTVALLQQHANTKIPSTGWNTVSPRRHEVMKAVLMNSVDKFKDDGSIDHPVTGNPIPAGRLLGMERTVLKENASDTWFQSEAYLELDNPLFDDPLDEEMGTGHLNAKRALQQFIPGEHELNGNYGEPTVGNVPHIGWDFGTIAAEPFPINKYKLEGNLQAGHWFSATLVWDRLVELATDGGIAGQFDANDTFQADALDDLDLYLVPAGTNDVGENDTAISQCVGCSEEHIFFEIPETGEYELWVYGNSGTTSLTNYGLAWWYGLAPEIEPPDTVGDFDGDNDVDGRDFLVWQRNPSVGDLADWQANYGTGSLNAATAVPEPSGVLMAWCALAMIGVRRAAR
jgi:hypothetical protein